MEVSVQFVPDEEEGKKPLPSPIPVCRGEECLSFEEEDTEEDESFLQISLKSLLKHCLTTQERIKTDKKLNGPGIYFLTSETYYQPDAWNQGKDILVKVGSATNVRDRLETYLLYYPTGFYLFGVVFTPSGSELSRFENQIGYMLKPHRIPRVERTHGHFLEWFRVDRTTLKESFLYLKGFGRSHPNSVHCFDFFQEPTLVQAVRKIQSEEKKKKSGSRKDTIKYTPKKQSRPFLTMKNSNHLQTYQEKVRELAKH